MERTNAPRAPAGSNPGRFRAAPLHTPTERAPRSEIRWMVYPGTEDVGAYRRCAGFPGVVVGGGRRGGGVGAAGAGRVRPDVGARSVRTAGRTVRGQAPRREGRDQHR